MDGGFDRCCEGIRNRTNPFRLSDRFLNRRNCCLFAEDQRLGSEICIHLNNGLLSHHLAKPHIKHLMYLDILNCVLCGVTSCTNPNFIEEVPFGGHNLVRMSLSYVCLLHVVMICN